MPTPESADSFVGRKTELDALHEELAVVRDGTPRLVLIEGPSGIGALQT